MRNKHELEIAAEHALNALEGNSLQERLSAITHLKTALDKPFDAFERGRQAGMKQERALWELSRLGQEPAAQCEYIRHTKEGTHWCALAEKTAAWVGLTDEDIALFDWESFKTKKDCSRAIEAKLKEKNT